MLREVKHQIVAQLKGDIERAAAVLVVDFTGLTVAEVEAFRRKVREIDGHYRVVKNTLLSLALEGTSYADAAKVLKGTPTGLMWSNDDPVAPARLAQEFAKTCEHIKFKGGVLDKKAIGPKEAEALAKMPSRREMQAQIVSMILGPGSRLLSQIKSAEGRVLGAIEAKAKE